MTVINSREFLVNPLHYLKMASTKEIAIKRGKNVYRIIHERPKYINTIDPEDPYWDDERNYNEFIKRINMTEEENPIVATLYTDEDIRDFLGLSEDEV